MEWLRARRRTILAGHDSVAAVAESFLAACTADPTAVRSFAFMDPELVRAEARALDDRVRGIDPEGCEVPLLGALVGVKDLIDVRGMPTLCGSTIAPPGRRTLDAPVVARLRGAGALIVAKTTSHEFGLGAASPPARHPLAADRLAGGSSGGSAAGVASGLIDLSLATDSVGSTREPAALCGIVGLRTRVGSVRNEGVHQLTASLSAVGLMTPTLDELEVLWDAVDPAGGIAQRGGTKSREPAFAVPTQFLARCGEDALAILEHAMLRLEESGVPCTEVELDDLNKVEAAVLVVMGHEGAARLADGVLASAPGDVHPTTRLYLHDAADINSQVYARALAVIDQFRAHVDGLRRSFTALLTPGQYLPAPLVAESEVRIRGIRWRRDLALINPFLAFSGLTEPSLTVPIGAFPDSALPMGAQLVGLHDESQLFRDARAVRAASNDSPARLARPAPSSP